jgi:hypothetical protein
MAVAQRHRASRLFPRRRIFAMVILDGPLGMIADPLRDVGLGGENALLQRSLPRELQMLLLAKIGLSDLADHHHDLNESHLAAPSKRCPAPPSTHAFRPNCQSSQSARRCRQPHETSTGSACPPPLAGEGSEGEAEFRLRTTSAIASPPRPPLPDPPPQAGEGEESAVASFASEFYWEPRVRRRAPRRLSQGASR